MRFNRRQLAISAATIPFIGSPSAFSQSATPPIHLSDRVELAAASSRITTLGQYVPGGQRDTFLDFNWIDFERQVFHVGHDLDDVGKYDALAMTSFGTGLDLLALLSPIEAEIGFKHLNVLQAMSSRTEQSDDQISQRNDVQVFHLDLEVAELTPIWERAGYQKRDNEFGSYWTLSENDEIDYDIPIQNIVFGSLNNVVLLDDHSIAFTKTSDVLHSVMAIAAGEETSVLNGLDSVTAALPEDAISAIYADGSVFRYEIKYWYSEQMVLRINDVIAISNDAVGPMPTLRTVVAGTTQGASRDETLNDQNAMSYIILETNSAAEQAASVVAWRHDNLVSLTSGESYREMLGEIEINVFSDDVLRITSSTGAVQAVFSQMLSGDDDFLFMYQSHE